MVRNFYLKSAILTNNHLSACHVSSGVPLASILSPLLFLIYNSQREVQLKQLLLLLNEQRNVTELCADKEKVTPD